MQKNNIKGSAILCLASLIWGLAFVAQTDAADAVPPFAVNSARSFVAAVFLFAFLAVRGGIEHKNYFKKPKEDRKLRLFGCLLCGIMLTVAVNLQQAGLTVYPEDTAAAARGGFLTALYVIIVPVFSVFTKNKPSPVIWVAVIAATVGIYLLCLSGGFGGIYAGDLLMLACAVSFSLHIMSVDRFGTVVGGAELSMWQFVICGVLSAALSLIFEKNGFALQNLITALPQILYLGIMSSGVAYTLQIIGQKYAQPAVASLSMSLESVFAALGGFVISGNTLTVRELFGCVCVFSGIIAVQIPDLKKS